jgi:hypothetical protein
MTEINDEEFIHAIFAQMCSGRSMQDRLIEDFDLKQINRDKDIIILSRLDPIIISNGFNTSNLSLKNKKRTRKNTSKKKNKS